MLIVLILVVFGLDAAGQSSPYRDSLAAFQRRYVETHEVVKGPSRDSLRFYPIDAAYRVDATFTPAKNSRWFSMETSGSIRKTFRIYGILRFRIHDTLQELQVLQGQYLGDDPAMTGYLFLPFTDGTTGAGTYESGRYIDLQMREIRDGRIEVDFNKAYNPYCAYVSGKYNCPVPPPANQLKIAVQAGEQRYH